jgi:hypothetical protein
MKRIVGPIVRVIRRNELVAELVTRRRCSRTDK